MPGIHIRQFAGLMPELSARNRPQVSAQVAHNCLLRDGALRPMARWKKFRRLTVGTSNSHIYENPLTRGIVNAYDYSEAAFLTGEPFAKNMVVGIDNATHSIAGYTSNIFQTIGIGDSPSVSSYPAGIPTPTFTGASALISSYSTSYVAELLSVKPVNRILGITFCRKIGGGMQEGPMAVIPGQAPFGIVFEGDTLQMSLGLNTALLTQMGITHIRIYRTISGLDSGEKAGNEMDTDWHLIDTLPVMANINYSDGGAATTDPMDVYLAQHFYQPRVKAQHFGLTEGGWFYSVTSNGLVNYSERYLHYAWPLENLQDIRCQVTAAVTHFDNIYIGTTLEPYVIALAPGEPPLGVQASATRFQGRLPCLGGTMVAAPGGALYASSVGLVALSRSGQKVITAGITNSDDVLFRQTVAAVEGPPAYSAYKDEIRFARTRKAVFHEGMYYGFVTSYQDRVEASVSRLGYAYHTGEDIFGDNQFGQLVTYDVPSGVIDQATVTYRGLTIKYANDLFCLPLPGNGTDKEYSTSPKACFQWKSKKFVFPGTMTLAAGKIIHDCGGAITIKLYVDCRCVWQADICDCENFRIPSQILGVEFEVEVFGKTPIHEIHLASSMAELTEEQ